MTARNKLLLSTVVRFVLAVATWSFTLDMGDRIGTDPIRYIARVGSALFCFLAFFGLGAVARSVWGSQDVSS